MDEKYYRILAENLRVERARKNISQQRLAILSGISIETIGAIERMQANPTIDTLVCIAKALEVDLNALLPLK